MSGMSSARDLVVFMGTYERIGKVGKWRFGDRWLVWPLITHLLRLWDGVWNEVMACMMIVVQP